MPSQPFKPGETVTVGTGLSIAGANAGTYSFTIANPAGGVPLAGADRCRGSVTTSAASSRARTLCPPRSR